MEMVRDTCSKYDVLLVADEIITGIAKTGAWFESEKHGITARGEIQSDGTYTLRTYGGKKSPDGAVLGEHKVAIKAFQEGAASASGDEEPGVGKPAIPEKYLYTYDSGIVKEVTEGPNDIPIKLQGQVPQ